MAEHGGLAHGDRTRRGITIFFTGLPCAGKTTLAQALHLRLLEQTGRPVTLLDGDVVRKLLSSELGFSKEHRDLNIRRIGFVATEVTRHGGIAICAAIAPYDAVRKEVRTQVGSVGRFFLVYVATPLSVCETRDVKGLYTKARAGIFPAVTGISDPYEPPDDADLRLDTREMTPAESADRVLAKLVAKALL